MSSLPDYQPIGKNSIESNQKYNRSVRKNNDDDSSTIGKDRNTKIDSSINLQSKFRANRFLRVHLHILKALYEQQRSTQSMSGDCRVEDKYWDVVEAFLKERNSIKKMTKRTQRMCDIHDEAKEFQKQISPFSIINNHVISHQVSPQFKRLGNRTNDPKGHRSNLTFGSSALLLITQPSPHFLPNRPSLGWNGTRGCNSGGRDTMEDDGGNAFGIVSGLLKRKHDLASRHLNQRTSKLRALVKESRSRIEILNSELIAEKDKETSMFESFGTCIDDFIIAKEECEDCQVKIETKIRLWKLLLHDLLGTISVQSQPIGNNDF
jgi:hypothetical protein